MTDFKVKLHRIRFRLGLRPRPRGAGGAYILAVFGGRAASWQGRVVGEEEEKRKGREGEVEGREREGPQVTVEPGPVRALLRHWENHLPVLFP